MNLTPLLQCQQLTSRLEVGYIIAKNTTFENDVLLHKRTITIGTACACAYQDVKPITSVFRFILEKKKRSGKS